MQFRCQVNLLSAAALMAALGIGACSAQAQTSAAVQPLPYMVGSPATITPAEGTPNPNWIEPHPEIPYMAKPRITVPADYVVEHAPVTPNASPEARALLHMLYTISGKHTMTGQQNGGTRSDNSEIAAELTGKDPVIYGADFGFGAGDAASRHEEVKHLIDEWRSGRIIAMCWHEVPPTMDEPVDFHREIQSRITDRQFDDLLTPGTAVYKHWCSQIDTIAELMKELQDAHVPVLWRPLHEINGNWFWWNGIRGDASHGSKQLYRQEYDRLVNFHHLTNLIWVWNPDRPIRADRQYVDYFPGIQYCDVLALDCYNEYKQYYYDDLNALSEGKVMAIAETYVPPSLEIYKTQPKWAYYMRWSPPTRELRALLASNQRQQAEDTFAGVLMHSDQPTPPNALTGAQLRSIVDSPRLFSVGDESYQKAVDPVRFAAGLPALK